MTDYFALFEQPRQPWIEPDELKQKYHRLTLGAHPDAQAESNSQSGFAEVIQAYRTLSDPKQRLVHLLTLEGRAPAKDAQAVPNDLADLFLEVGQLNQKIDLVIKKRADATSGLGKALLAPERLDMEKRVQDQLDRLRAIYNDELRELQNLNVIWRTNRFETLAELREIYGKISYLSRWIEQLEEKHFQLSLS